MPHDALDPGDGTYPYAPRNADGTLDRRRFPTGLRRHRDPETGRIVLVDLTPRRADGSEIIPPTIPPTP